MSKLTDTFRELKELGLDTRVCWLSLGENGLEIEFTPSEKRSIDVPTEPPEQVDDSEAWYAASEGFVSQ